MGECTEAVGRLYHRTKRETRKGIKVKEVKKWLSEEKFHVNWNDLQELMQSERSGTRRTLLQRQIHCGTIECNGILH